MPASSGEPVVEEDGAVRAPLLGRVQEEPHQKRGDPETADGGPLLRADARPPRGPAGGHVHPFAGDRRRGGDGEDQGVADGARTGAHRSSLGGMGPFTYRDA